MPPNLQLPSPAPSLSPLSDTPPHLRNISSAGVQQPRRYAAYHCYRQQLRHCPTVCDGRASCLVTHITTSTTTTWDYAVSCYTHTTTTRDWNRRGGLILFIPCTVFNASSSPHCQKTTKKKKNTTIGMHPWCYNQFSSFTRGANLPHAHHPQTRSIASTFSR